ncbi:EKC/KEOPS complex subunit BUD32 [Vanrija pseudolonga]|uniref:EKC/KEOPS complex subunit BUD32 n=1 Tax=Vanrija pseudolonga TaxID=143232 RepID=A0AAF1BL38_9TREE|nr:EKC/KEOPS complex subunit BUD32 [Vanrija pseudolonga]
MTTYEYAAPSLGLIEQAELLKQGAEAKVFALPSLLPPPEVYYPPLHPAASSSKPTPTPTPTPTAVILKHRFPKTYRHPSLDASLTRTRLQFEARALARCARAGVSAPRVLWVDEPAGVVAMERVDGWSVREILGGGAEGEVEVGANDEVERDAGAEAVVQEEEEEAAESDGLKALRAAGVAVPDLMTAIGAALARLHATAIIHGDLTTSNMMVRMTPGAAAPYEVVLIDFGLASTASMPESYAVDLYVLERAFASTHPASEGLYAGVLEAYGAGLGEKKWKPIETKLKEVRLRGRKRDMTG